MASPTSPRSPGSPDAVYGSNSETATPTAAFHNGTETPTSPKLRKDSKSIFSNFSANKSSTRITNQEPKSRQGSGHDMQPPFYINGRNGGSTPELNRPIQTPNSDDTRSDPEQRPGPQSNTVSEPYMDSRHTATKSKKQAKLGRSKSIKTEETSSGRALPGSIGSLGDWRGRRAAKNRTSRQRPILAPKHLLQDVADTLGRSS
jgi:hypothetical protein